MADSRFAVTELEDLPPDLRERVGVIHEKSGFGVLAADLDSATPPPAGEPELLVGRDGDVTSSSVLYYWRFTVDWAHLTAFVTGTLSAPILKFDRPSEDAWSMLLDQGVTTIGLGALDTLLADTPLARVQLRGQEGEQGTTYSAAYRVNNQVIVEGNYQAASNSSSNPDGPAAGNVGAAVDWRFAPRWSVRGQLGTIGTGVDLVYQYRY